ncbi:BCCT family transporter [uncultured Halopseudomonas sp.]|uniref:BCCT family transporter n=1 Tax=uncultured Halopseudomonas sp. TaxID=2901193 RepID=UPI0030EBFB62
MLERLQRRLGLQTIPGVFFTSAGIAALFVALAIPFDEAVAGGFGQLTGWVARNLGWFYILSVSSLLIFLLGLACSRYGDIRLGADDSRPDYSNLTWFTMLFAAGIGTILMFWGVAEPISHFANPPYEGVDPGSGQAASDAMTMALYHFGLHTWTIFAMPCQAWLLPIFRTGTTCLCESAACSIPYSGTGPSDPLAGRLM